MTQFWTIINIDSHRSMGFDGLGIQFFGNSDCPDPPYPGNCNLVCWLLKPRPLPKKYSTSQCHGHIMDEIAVAFRANGNALSKLPTEIHDQIFQELDYESALLFSITCRYLSALAQPNLYRMANQYLETAQWAGDRLVCLGEYTRYMPTDLLPAGATKDHIRGCSSCEKEMEREYYSDILARMDSEEPQPDGRILFPLYTYASAHCPSPSRPREFSCVKTFEKRLGRKIRYNSDLFQWLREDYYFDSDEEETGTQIHCFKKEARRCGYLKILHTFYREYLVMPPSRCVLRNLTVREYVVNSGITGRRGIARGPFVEGKDTIGFEEVLKCQFCYSEDSSMSMYYEKDDIHQGPWAGHSFDITTMDDIEADRERGIEWVDVTEKVRRKVKGLWRDYYDVTDPRDDLLVESDESGGES